MGTWRYDLGVSREHCDQWMLCDATWRVASEQRRGQKGTKEVFSLIHYLSGMTWQSAWNREQIILNRDSNWNPNIWISMNQVNSAYISVYFVWHVGFLLVSSPIVFALQRWRCPFSGAMKTTVQFEMRLVSMSVALGKAVRGFLNFFGHNKKTVWFVWIWASMFNHVFFVQVQNDEFDLIKV